MENQQAIQKPSGFRYDALPLEERETFNSFVRKSGGDFTKLYEHQKDILNNLFKKGSQRVQWGFKIFDNGATIVDRLVNKGLYGVAIAKGATMEEIVRFKNLFYNESNGMIDSSLKEKLVESGRKAYRIGNSRINSETQAKEMEELYRRTFEKFEQYLSSLKS